MMKFPESEPLLSKAESFATGHSLLVTPKSTWYGLLNRFLLALLRYHQISRKSFPFPAMLLAMAYGWIESLLLRASQGKESIRVGI